MVSNQVDTPGVTPQMQGSSQFLLVLISFYMIFARSWSLTVGKGVSVKLRATCVSEMVSVGWRTLDGDGVSEVVVVVATGGEVTAKGFTGSNWSGDMG